MMERFQTRLVSLCFREEGGKKVIHKRRAVILGLTVFVVGVTWKLVPDLLGNDLPKGGVSKSDAPLLKGADQASTSAKKTASNSLGGVTDNAPTGRPARHGPFKPIHYKAKQVLGPDANAEKIPSGANFVAKLLTSVDTRSPQKIHASLPYGGSHRSGGGSLPPGTILMGDFNYSGDGPRVFMNFTLAVLPDGQEVSIQAQGLSSKDYRSGVIGELHSNHSDQMASVLGLSMVEGMSEVMVQREGLGQAFEATPKATLQNGLYNGLAKVAGTEANDQATRIGHVPNYVTIDSGSDLIISLGESFIKNERPNQ
jgi:hypothetical protein